MAKHGTPHGSKNLIIVIVLLVAAAAGFGYFTQTSELRETDASANPATGNVTGDAMNATQPPAVAPLPAANSPIFGVRTGDIVIGQAAAPITIVEYASLSCPHCEHFHSTVVPKLKKDYIDTGKAKLVFRHFPLNEPALRAAELVECAPADKRAGFVDALFDGQKNWAFDAKFFEGLRQIAAVGGIDSARFDSCMTDKTIENRLLAIRMEATKSLHIEHTPTLFANGVQMQGEANYDNLKKAIGK